MASNLRAVLFLSIIALVTASSLSQKCETVVAIPFGSDEKTCGYMTHQYKLASNAIATAAQIRTRIGTAWVRNVYSAVRLRKWDATSMPMGTNMFCPQVQALAPVATEWTINTNLFIRREFEMDAVTISKISGLKVEYIVDNHLVSTYINGEPFAANFSERHNCVGVTAVDSFFIPASMLQEGSNLLAIHAMDLGGMSFFNMQLSYELCSEGDSALQACSTSPGGSTCRVRCAEEDSCSEKTDCPDKAFFDIEGNCLCEAAPAMFCSGPTGVAPLGVCYKSPWVAGHAAKLVGCAPAQETECS